MKLILPRALALEIYFLGILNEKVELRRFAFNFRERYRVLD